MSPSKSHWPANTKWKCDDCGWAWPYRTPPPAGAECDNCGGELLMTVERPEEAR